MSPIFASCTALLLVTTASSVALAQNSPGSWNANPPAGYEIARIDFEDGEPVSFEPFISGWLSEEGEGHAQLARLAGLAVTPRGALLAADDQNGVIYRVRYVGDPE